MGCFQEAPFLTHSATRVIPAADLSSPPLRTRRRRATRRRRPLFLIEDSAGLERGRPGSSMLMAIPDQERTIRTPPPSRIPAESREFSRSPRVPFASCCQTRARARRPACRGSPGTPCSFRSPRRRVAVSPSRARVWSHLHGRSRRCIYVRPSQSPRHAFAPRLSPAARAVPRCTS